MRRGPNSLAPSPATLFDQGTMVCLTGQNAGLTRTIRQMTSGVAYQLQAWLYPVSVGDTFRFLPGCDHTTATCHNTFNNLARYGGFPYIPRPKPRSERWSHFRLHEATSTRRPGESRDSTLRPSRKRIRGSRLSCCVP